MTGHIALLGDSVFDNKAYIGPEPDVVEHLRQLLPPSWRATLIAVDGRRLRIWNASFSAYRTTRRIW